MDLNSGELPNENVELFWLRQQKVLSTEDPGYPSSLEFMYFPLKSSHKEPHPEGAHDPALIFHNVMVALTQKGDVGSLNIKTSVLTVEVRYSECRITVGAVPLCDWECGSLATRRRIQAAGGMTYGCL